MNLFTKTAALVVLMIGFGGSANAQESELPDQARGHFHYLVGTWDYSYQIGEKTYHGVWKAGLTENKLALAGNFTAKGSKGNATGTSLLGWDASKKQLVAIAFVDPNGYQSTRFTFETAEILNGSMQGALPNGEPTSTKYRFERTKSGFTYKIFNGVEAGEPQPDRLLTFKRREK